MAKANTPAPSTAVARAKLNLPAGIDAEAQKEAAAIAKRVGAPSGDKMTVTQAKTFRLPNGTESPGPLNVIIVDFVAGNFLYDKEFDRNNITPPKCFAIGMEPSGLVPSENAIERQAESCAACWANQWSTDPKGGRGKACQNTRLLAIMASDATADSKMMILKVSKTAVRSFDGYVTDIAEAYKSPPRNVITEISFSSDDYSSLRFGNPQPASAAQVLLANSKKEGALARLLTEPEFSPATEPAAKGKTLTKPALAKPAATRRKT